MYSHFTEHKCDLQCEAFKVLCCQLDPLIEDTFKAHYICSYISYNMAYTLILYMKIVTSEPYTQIA